MFVTLKLSFLFCTFGVLSANINDCTDIDSKLDSIFSSNLCGELILPTDEDRYFSVKAQYAESSFPEAIAPSMIIKAVCDEDIKLSLFYAKTCNYSIAIRSGGHQYSGLSSCNSSCIQIDMIRYNHIEIEDANHIEMGPGVLLRDFYRSLDEHDLFLPGGECGYVALGGHVQTGGYGHTLRSHGVLLDYVLAFDIILSDGNTAHIMKLGTYSDVGNVYEFNDDLYWSVVGGSPGSWGIITNYEFYANKNEDTSTSTLSECVWLYNSTVLRELLTNYIDINNNEQYLNDPNNGIWFTLAKREPFDVDIMKIFCLWSGLDNKPYDDTFCHHLFDSAKALDETAKCFEQNVKLSTAHLTHWILDEDREFPLPFVKSVRASKTNLKSEFIEGYISKLNEIFDDPLNGLFMITQLISAGGAGSRLYQNDPINELTSLSYRDYHHCLTADLFYAESMNPNSKQIALEWRQNAWDQWLNATQSFNDGIDQRATWGTFESVDIDEVWKYYYEPSQFQRLKEIKRKVDPINLFKNQFTIPLDDDFLI